MLRHDEVNDNKVSKLATWLIVKGKNENTGAESNLPTLTNPASPSDVAALKDYISANGNRKVGTLAERTGDSDIIFSMPANDTVPKVEVKSGIYRSSGEAFLLDIPTEDVSIAPNGDQIDRIHQAGKLIRKVTVQGDDNLTAGNIKKGITIYGETGSYDGDNLSDVLGDNSGKSNREKIVNAIGSANAVTGESDETLTGAIGSLSEGYVSADTIGEATGTTSQEKVEYLIGVVNETIDGTPTTTLADAVDTLIDGYGHGGGGTEVVSYATELYRTFYGAENLPDTVTVYAPNCITLRGTFSNINSGAKVINVTAGTVANLRDGFVGGTSATSKNTTTEILNLNCTFSNCNFTQGFNQATALREINGELDLTGGSSYESMFSGSNNIEKLTFRPNSISSNIKFHGLSKLTDATLISIANGLDGTANDRTLTLSKTAPTGGVAPFNRCETIMGTVSSGVFSANADGSVSLASFIQNTKGWTLAGA